MLDETLDIDLVAIAAEIEAQQPNARPAQDKQQPKRQPLPSHLPRREILPGAAVTVVLWLVLASLFSFYLQNLARFSVTYGSLGGIVLTLMFFYLTAAPFDIYKLYWERACNGALKIKDDRFRRDVMILAPEAKISMWMEPDGSFTILLHPKVKDVEAVEREITTAGEKAGMTITFAPGLFG